MDMTLDEIKEHNSTYYNEADEEIWKQRKILTIDGIKVPQYIYNGQSDPLDHSTAIYNYISDKKQSFEGKKFLDIGTCAGINNILLTKAGFEVVGLDNSIYSLNASLYTMKLNDVYYKVVHGDHNDISKMNYDVLIVNQMDYIPGFMAEMRPIFKKERDRGKYVMMSVTRVQDEIPSV
jgi:2-polyprenyl-3-methyl-5-hydroxy-6-metoxy-1,4-benzoquinol methylase